MNWANFALDVVKGVAAFGVHRVVTNAISATTPKDQKPVDKVLTIIGSYVISGYLAERGAEHVENEIKSILKPLTPNEGESSEKSE